MNFAPLYRMMSLDLKSEADVTDLTVFIEMVGSIYRDLLANRAVIFASLVM